MEVLQGLVQITLFIIDTSNIDVGDCHCQGIGCIALFNSQGTLIVLQGLVQITLVIIDTSNIVVGGCHCQGIGCMALLNSQGTLIVLQGRVEITLVSIDNSWLYMSHVSCIANYSSRSLDTNNVRSSMTAPTVNYNILPYIEHGCSGKLGSTAYCSIVRKRLAGSLRNIKYGV